MSTGKTKAKEEFLLTFVTPTTTDRAYNFGLSSAENGHQRLSHDEFLSKLEEDHPFPQSLYRAYRRGFARGRVARDRVQAAGSSNSLLS